MALLREAIDAPACQAEVATWAGLLAQLAHLEYRIDRYDAAQASAERALAALRKAPAHDAQIQALTVLASCALQTGRLLDARTLYQRTLALAPPDLLAHNRAAVLGNLALVEKRLGNYPQALQLHIESLAQHRRIGDSAGVALCLNNLATMYMLLGQWDAAAVHLAECLSIAERDGLVAIQSYARTNLADVARQRGDLDAATLHVERGLELSRSVANRGTEYSLLLQRARIAVRRGDLVGARSALAQALAGATAIGMPSLQSDAVLCFAELLEAQGQAALARRVLAFAMEHPATLPADRNALRAQWERRVAATPEDPPWPGMGRDELLQRIVAEHEVAHAPLIGALGGGGL
jgi:tetratricopeptide (TPR) repeat protein